MRKSSSPFSLRLTALAATLILLSACSQLPHRPGPLPIIVKCQPPAISPGLLTPPSHQAADHLLEILGMPPVNVATPSSGSPPSKPN